MGGMPQPTPEQIEALQKQMGGKLRRIVPGAAGGLGRCRRACRVFPVSAPKDPGLPGLGGFPFGGRRSDRGLTALNCCSALMRCPGN